MKASRFICFILAAVLLGGLFSFSAAAKQVEPSYIFSAEYLNSSYYRRLMACELTGDLRHDVITVALSQIGYHEGNSDADMDGMNIDGGKNFVEYNRLYGKVDNQEGNGVSYGYAWCAAFVSWSLRQAGVPVGYAQTEISCGRMTYWYERNDIFVAQGEGFVPELGDIIMFANDSSPSHVGLVLGVKGGYVYTVEGNNGGKVAVHKYKENDDYIYGYCLPKYPEVEGADYTELFESAIDMTGDYVINVSSLNARAKADTESEIVAELVRGDEVTVTEVSDSGRWGKIDVDGKEAWIYLAYATDAQFAIFTVHYDLDGGDGIMDQRKLKGDTLEITKATPFKKGHSFKGWSSVKDADTPDYAAGQSYSADADITLYALWEPLTYTVTFYSDDGSIIQQSEHKYGEKVPVPETVTKPDDDMYSYTFTGWNKEPVFLVVRDLKYTAIFEATPLPPKTEADGIDLVIRLAIGGAVLVVVAGAVVTVIMLKKKKKKALADSAE
ncbi:MAG: InlB B-repeat-containing protein [Clostridia bacterium]|nr:InlB B-repeat-containing protein [Clostridia bacterium]